MAAAGTLGYTVTQKKLGTRLREHRNQGIITQVVAAVYIGYSNLHAGFKAKHIVGEREFNSGHVKIPVFLYVSFFKECLVAEADDTLLG
ncbi:MAG: hypothetical protein ACTHYN_15770 [Marinobacter sp.]|uniref:hypothetical protein n=1 Tax=Marinobacter sp. TaxID=50741 RepID=UPI003F9D039D